MRYHYYFTPDRRTICTTTFAGQTVKAVVRCSPNDPYDKEYGKKLAKAKVDIKVGEKRVKRAQAKLIMASTVAQQANDYERKMIEYVTDARAKLAEYEDAYRKVYDNFSVEG